MCMPDMLELFRPVRARLTTYFVRSDEPGEGGRESCGGGVIMRRSGYRVELQKSNMAGGLRGDQPAGVDDRSSSSWSRGRSLSVVRTCQRWHLSFSSLVIAGHGRAAACNASIYVLLLLLRRFENLQPLLAQDRHGFKQTCHTWKEQRRLSSTLIMAPALSNSPQ